jgi:hypothetical protein
MRIEEGEEVAMRTRNKAFLSCALLGGVLLTAPGAMAQTDSCSAGRFLVEAFGPTVVPCAYPEGCTEIRYDISNGVPDHVAAVVASGPEGCDAMPTILSVTGSGIEGIQSYDPGVGDPVTGLGTNACHEEATKVNPNADVPSFTIRVRGTRGAALKSVAVKKGQTHSCQIVSIGKEGGTPIAPVQETLTHEDCSVVFTLNAITGAVLHAELTSDSDPDCDFVATDVENLNITVDDEALCNNPPCNLGPGRFGQGYIHSDNQSCTTRIIGGRLYTWGNPCPN